MQLAHMKFPYSHSAAKSGAAPFSGRGAGGGEGDGETFAIPEEFARGVFCRGATPWNSVGVAGCIGHADVRRRAELHLPLLQSAIIAGKLDFRRYPLPFFPIVPRCIGERLILQVVSAAFLVFICARSSIHRLGKLTLSRRASLIRYPAFEKGMTIAT